MINYEALYMLIERKEAGITAVFDELATLEVLVKSGKDYAGEIENVLQLVIQYQNGFVQFPGSCRKVISEADALVRSIIRELSDTAVSVQTIERMRSMLEKALGELFTVTAFLSDQETKGIGIEFVGKPVPFLLREKLAPFENATQCLELIVNMLKSGTGKHSDTIEKLLRAALEQYPISSYTGVNRDGLIDILEADGLVLQAWHIVQPNSFNDRKKWERALRLLKRAEEIIRCVYVVEAQKTSNGKPATKESRGYSEGREKVAGESIEPFRLRSLYRRYK